MSFHWKVAPPKIQQDLLAAKAVGEKTYEIFRVERLESQPPQTKFNDTIPKAKLQTFTDLNEKGASQEQNVGRDHPES